jgi:hypothetical protein
MSGATAAGRDTEDVEYFRVARRLLQQRVHTLGLMPASHDVDVPELARRLGEALARLSDVTVVVITPWARFSDKDVEPSSEVIGTWLAPRVAWIAPTKPASAGGRAAQLVSLVNRVSARRVLVLVDLSTLDETGEQLAVTDGLDATCILARAGATLHRDLLRCHRQLGASADLGVLIVDS